MGASVMIVFLSGFAVAVPGFLFVAKVIVADNHRAVVPMEAALAVIFLGYDAVGGGVDPGRTLAAMQLAVAAVFFNGAAASSSRIVILELASSTDQSWSSSSARLHRFRFGSDCVEPGDRSVASGTPSPSAT
jgi:hypothetical protein